jgi:adenylate kinase family enzyme
VNGGDDRSIHVPATRVATMRRIAVVGNSGSGKTTLGRSVADILAVPFVELDAIYHQAGWRSLPVEEFRQRVGAIAAGAAWVIDGNYSAVRDLVWARADTVIWFDLPRHTVMRQVLGRTLRRAVTRAELWNGNHEPLTGLLRRTQKSRWSGGPGHSTLNTASATPRRRRTRATRTSRSSGSDHGPTPITCSTCSPARTRHDSLGRDGEDHEVESGQIAYLTRAGQPVAALVPRQRAG